MTEPLPLSDLQRWFLAAITHPAGVQSSAAVSEIDKQILPSRQQTAAERLAVYSHAYFARLLEVLRDLFPCLRFAVGDELFDQFAAQYLEAHPPTSYTLHHLADQFADFLHATRPAGAGAWVDFVVDLARLEHAIDQVFDGPGPEQGLSSFNPQPEAQARPSAGVTPDTFASGCGLNEPTGKHLSLTPGFRLLAFAFPVSTFFTAWKAGEQPAWPEAQAEYVALLRRDYIVRRHVLTLAQHDLLAQLAGGQSLDEALATVADRVTPDEIERWFTHWSAAGFFVSS